jgi:soluble lytic murein transglycosylase-like protein
MIHASDKTIRDYMHPDRLRRPAVHDLKGKSKGFEGILKTACQRDAERAAPRIQAITIQDYLRKARSVPVIAIPPSFSLEALVSGHSDAGDSDLPQDSAPATDPAAPADPPLQGQIDQNIQMAASKYGLSPHLLRSVIRHESNFDPQAVSPAGAQGLMQLMPATARELGVHDPFDIEQNIDGGARYLRQMLDCFKGNRTLALAAYNAGPGTISRYGGVPPYPETRRYVQKVLSDARPGRV